jgi:hypothetical protein
LEQDGEESAATLASGSFANCPWDPHKISWPSKHANSQYSVHNIPANQNKQKKLYKGKYNNLLHQNWKYINSELGIWFQFTYCLEIQRFQTGNTTIYYIYVDTMSRIAWSAAVSQETVQFHQDQKSEIFTVDIQHGYMQLLQDRVFCFSSYSVVPLWHQIRATGKEKQEKTRNETVARFISIPQDLQQRYTWLAFSSGTAG